MCVVNAGVIETSLVDAFEHGLDEVEPTAGNGYSGCLFEVCHGAGGGKVRYELLNFREHSGPSFSSPSFSIPPNSNSAISNQIKSNLFASTK